MRHRPFQYEPLGSPDSEIRLLDLLPGPGVVRCRLRKIALDSANDQYEPLSYCWGDQKHRVNIVVDDGYALPIGTNLDAALRRLRFEKDHVRALWVDAVCINQSNVPEKNVQVKLMKRIYQSGRRTLIWLGEHDAHTAEVFHILNTLAGHFRQNPDMDQVRIREWRAIYSGAQLGPRKHGIKDRMIPQHILATPQYRRMLSKLGTVFERSWFRRVWIIQEIAVSSEAKVICGDSQIDWKDIEIVRAFTLNEMTSRGYLDLLVDQRNGFESPINNMVDMILLSGTQSEATNPRDRVYAMLGLMTPVLGDRQINYPLQIDYGASVNKIFIDATKHCIGVTGRLTILTGSAGCRGYESSGLPSWALCPAQADDHTVINILWNDIGPTSYSDESKWRASKYSKCAAAFDDGDGDGNENILCLRGLVLDRIANAGQVREMIPRHPLKARDYPKAVRQFLKAIRCYFKWRAVAGVDIKLDRTEQAEVDANIGESTREAFERTVCYPAGAPGETGTEFHSREQFRVFDRFMVREFSFLADLETSATSHHHARIRDDVRILARCVKCLLGMAKSDREDLNSANGTETNLSSWWENKRLVTTERDRIGMTSRYAQVGDSVVLLAGSDRPYILRPVGSRWRIVSECYIHEIMHGEAWDESNCETLWIE